MVIVNIEGGVAHEKYTVSAYSANGALLGEHHFNGTNTSVYLPSTHGTIILRISGNGLNEAFKAVMK